jgi:hypothetical protein
MIYRLNLQNGAELFRLDSVSVLAKAKSHEALGLAEAARGRGDI